MDTRALPLIAGLGGAVVGYVGATLVNSATRPRPMITVSVPNPIPRDTPYTIFMLNFPPNTQIVAPRNLSVSGGELVNIGITDSKGTLATSGTAMGVGTYYIVFWDAPTGQYVAMYTLIVV